MLDKLNQYRQSFIFPFQKKNSKNAAYKFEWVSDLNGLREIQQFRAAQFSKQFGIRFDQNLDQDFYDFNCEHAVLRDKWTREIAAYTRIKLLQGHELKEKSYSQQEFNISEPLGHLENIVEIGRTCVHPKYRSGKALSILWLHLMPKVLWEMKAKHVIGCVSIRMQGNEARAYHTHQLVQRLHEQSNTVQAHQAFTLPYPVYSFSQDERMPKLFDIYLKMQATLSREAYYDEAFNCLDYFVHLEVSQMAKNFILQKKIMQNS